jgi:hypothetical protein
MTVKRAAYIAGNATGVIPQPTNDTILKRINNSFQWAEDAAPFSETLSITSNGQTTFTLSKTPVDGYIDLYLNQLKIEYSDYTVSNTTITYSGSYSISTSDKLEASYLSAVGSLSGNVTSASTVRSPTEMVFTEIYKRAYFDGTSTTVDRIFPENLKWVDDNFTDTSTTRFTTFTESTLGTLSISNGTCSLTNTSGTARSTFVVESNPINMPQVMAMVDVVSITGSNPAWWANVVGVIKDGDNYIVVNNNVVAGVVSIQVKVNGSSAFSSSISINTGGYPYKLALSIVGNWATAFVVNTSGEWTKVISYNLTSINFKTENHSQWYGCFGMVTPGTYTNTVQFDNFKVGRFGGVGIRDINVITNEDGTPIINDNVVTAVATIAGHGGGISESSWGVFSIDLNKKTFTQTGLIMCNRGGSVENDHAGHIVISSNGDQRVLVSSWGDHPNPTRIYYKLISNSTNILEGSHVITSLSELNLTELPSGGGRYDPFLAKKGSEWFLAYTATGSASNSFYPVLDKSTNLTTWTNVGKDSVSLRYEGSKILNINGSFYTLWGGHLDMKIYDIDMNYIGILNILTPGDNTTQPWPMIIPHGNINMLITFDQQKWSNGATFAWGWIRWFASP